MKTFRTIAVTAIITAGACIAGSVLGAMVFSTGASAGSLAGKPTVQVGVQDVPMQNTGKSMQETYQPAQNASGLTAKPGIDASPAVLTDEQRIARLEARVSALEARVK